jgi:hypothetical protein
VLRLVLGAVVLAAGLIAALGAVAPDAALTGDSPRSGTSVLGSLHCTEGDGGEWNSRPDVPAPTSGSAWRCRPLAAVTAAAPDPHAVVATAPIASSQARAPAAPAHLLHIPLLI